MQMHQYALTIPHDTDAIVRFYTVTIPSQIQCFACLEKYNKMLQVYPIPNESSKVFEWTVHIHNIVNLMLHKPIMDLDEAKKRWST